jgi:hypothetical protein
MEQVTVEGHAMKSLLIAASVAAMTIGGAAYAASGSSGSPDNPQAGRNGFDNTMPGSSAASGGSMQNPAGKSGGAYTQGSGPATTSPGAQTAPSYGSSGMTNDAGPGAAERTPRPGKKSGGQ